MNMNRFTRGVEMVTKMVLAGSVVALLGAACWKGVGTNTNVGLANGNAVANENTNTVAGNVNVEVNANVSSNTNTNTNSTGEIDTSDWLTYTNEEYGFSFRYPGESQLIENENSLPYPGISFLSDVTVDNTKQEDFQGNTIAFALTDLALANLIEKIEQSDTSQGVTLAKVDSIQEDTLNQFTVYRGSHATAIGIPTDFYYVPLKGNFALFIFYNNDKNNLNSNIINTLNIEN